MTRQDSRTTDSEDYVSLSSALERCCQSAIAALSSPVCKDSRRDTDDIVTLGSILTAIATRFFARMSVPDRSELAEDAVQLWYQNMLVTGFRTYSSNDRGLPFAPYGIQALRNCCLYTLRQHHRECISNAPVERMDPRQDPSSLMEQSEMIQLVRNELALLPLDLRESLILTEQNGLTSKQAAEQLGTTATAINLRKHRGRAILRTRLTERF